jgi:hypothetical protein
LSFSPALTMKGAGTTSARMDILPIFIRPGLSGRCPGLKRCQQSWSKNFAGAPMSDFLGLHGHFLCKKIFDLIIISFDWFGDGLGNQGNEAKNYGDQVENCDHNEKRRAISRLD